ncbi:MAG: AraC family transcriptional regulator [Chloroflexi bacterium]|nr:AraC family transcriptional regulator [Chloroflexota bacterium]MCC6894272.1 AraC family transcriptional regulator [Anaerolineae bacterium]
MAGEQTHFWQSRELGNTFESLTATYITHSFARHTHEGFAIGVVVKGAETFYYRGEMHIAPAGSTVCICPDELHTGQAVTTDGWTYRMIYPAADLLMQVASQIAGKPRGIPYFSEPVFHDTDLYHALYMAHLALEEGRPALERETRLLDALTLMVRRYADDRPPLAQIGVGHDALRDAKDYLHAHYAEDVSLEQLAQAVYLSPFHLSRLFRERLSLPPHMYLNQIRINRTKTLLNTDMPLMAVAQSVGYADQSHLSKAFKRVVGITPGQYRKIRQDILVPSRYDGEAR